MIEQTGRVVAVERGVAWVQTVQQSTCNACSANKGCGTAVLNKLSGGRVTQTPCKDHLGVNVGDTVVIGIPDDALLKASFLVYFMPLMLLVLGALVGDHWWPGNELYSILTGLFGLFVGFALVKMIASSSRMEADTQPILVKRIAVVADQSPEVVTIINPSLTL
jgi:sigma-E factor negative regulatory protein RseC